mmetsp:Transcript_21464/g.42160  ORF Transcript_21464/g.42160 Transcript_21464/m.42160 type:complete len:686 (+) Transcript_21464:26-2083(+)
MRRRRLGEMVDQFSEHGDHYGDLEHNAFVVSPRNLKSDAKDRRIRANRGRPTNGDNVQSCFRTRTAICVMSILGFIIVIALMLVNEDGANISRQSVNDLIFTVLQRSNQGSTDQDSQTYATKSTTVDLPRERLRLSLDSTKFLDITQVSLTLGASERDLIVSFVVEEPKVRRSDRTCQILDEADRGFRLQAWPDPKEEVKLFNGSEDVPILANFTRQSGCVVSSTAGLYKWHYFVGSIHGLLPGRKYHYEIGQLLVDDATKKIDLHRKAAPGVFKTSFYSMRTLNSQPEIVVLGDTGPKSCATVLSTIGNEIDQRRVSLAVHVGDISYVSNQGECWKLPDDSPRFCEWDCTRSEKCGGRLRTRDLDFSRWASFADLFQQVSSRVPVISTMGNHDNDLHWFFRFRPPVPEYFPHVKFSASEGPIHGVRKHVDISKYASSRIQELEGAAFGIESVKQQAIVNELLAEPYFFSIDAGPFHIISIQSEDNGVNPYERATSAPWTPAQDARFNKHYGTFSAQYAWLKNDLESVDRTITPWVILISHRPYFSTSRHHPNCLAGGDWFGCRFRELYAPLIENNGVNLVLNGHSHHYSRTFPIHYNTNTNLAELSGPQGTTSNTRNAPVYVIIGTGGMELERGFFDQPNWVGFRTADDYGHAWLKAMDFSKLTWNYHSVSQANKLIDATTFEQ